ncbi:hypothetical protein EJB05_49368, partial [Eragrostis curvula]
MLVLSWKASDRMSDISEPSGDEKSAGDEIQAPAVH